MELKNEIRRTVREKLKTVDRRSESLRILIRLESLIPPSGGVLAFEALRDEPDIEPLVERLRREERLALVVGSRDEPQVDRSHFPIVTAIVPGRAFDRQGHRLGRGGGTFDRLLAGLDARRIGVAFDCQIVDELPVGGHDIPMHEIVTASHHIVVALRE